MADSNWAALKNRFPHAQRVHGVRGIAAAHAAAAELAHTRFFYVVDGDAEILDSFDFAYKPSVHEQEYVHVWHSINPATGDSYGYGGVKLFNKKFFRSLPTALDFSTSLTRDLRVIETPAATTRFNSDPLRAFRGTFREVVKLSLCVRDRTRPVAVRDEAAARLARWLDPLPSADFRECILRAGVLATERVESGDSAQIINDVDAMAELWHQHFKEIDLETSPLPSDGDPVGSEFFFTTRLAAILYDPYVAEHLKIDELRDACSDGQLLSKHWAVTQLRQIIEAEAGGRQLEVAIAGGWIGTLSLLMHAAGLPVRTTTIDCDARAVRIAEKLNWDQPHRGMVADMYSVNFSQWDVIVNTSSEHIADIGAWCRSLPPGRLVVLQNNNAHNITGHVSTVNSSSQLRAVSGFDKILYEGTRKFAQYDRFMIIARS